MRELQGHQPFRNKMITKWTIQKPRRRVHVQPTLEGLPLFEPLTPEKRFELESLLEPRCLESGKIIPRLGEEHAASERDFEVFGEKFMRNWSF